MAQWNLGVDILPTDNNKKLGDANSKFIVNGYNLNDACAKGVDTTVDASSANLPTSAAVANYVSGLKGANSGLAELDASGKVPSSQLPSFVDDVLEYADVEHFPLTGNSGTIYVAIDTNKVYRWSGSTYIEISSSYEVATTADINALFA